MKEVILGTLFLLFVLSFFKLWNLFRKRTSVEKTLDYSTLLRKEEENRDKRVRKDLDSSLHKHKLFEKGYVLLGEETLPVKKQKKKATLSEDDDTNVFRMFD